MVKSVKNCSAEAVSLTGIRVRSCPVHRGKGEKQLQTLAAGQHKGNQTGIPSPDSLSQAMPPWLAGCYV